MPTREQLESALRNADAAGDNAAAKQLANALKNRQYDLPEAQPQEVMPERAQQRSRGPQGERVNAMQQVREAFTGESRATPQIRSMQEIGAAPELNQMSVPAFKASLGLLTTGDTESLKGILTQQFGENVSFDQDEKGNPIVNLPSGSYALNQPGLSGQDIVRGAFDILSFTPSGRAATIFRSAGAAGATQAAIETAESATGGGFDPEDIALAAGLGAGGKALENVASAGYRAATGRPTGEAAEVARFAQEEKLPLMTTDVVQPSTFAGRSAQALGEKIPVAGTGAQRAAQQEAREDIVQRTARRFGEYDPADVYESLGRQSNKVKQAAGTRRSAIVDQIEDVVAVDDAVKAIDDEIAKLSRGPSGQPLKTADTQTVAKLNDYKEDLINDPSFGALEKLRTRFREDVKGERTNLNKSAETAISNVYKAMTKDMDDAVASNLGADQLKRWKSANTIFFNEADKLKRTRLKSAFQKGDVTPEVVNNMLYSQKPSEVRALYNSLDSKGRQAARAGIIAKAHEKSMGSPDKFLGELNRLQKSVGIAFKGADKAYVNGLKKYLSATKEAAEAPIRTKSGQELFQIGAPVGVMADIGATGGVGTAGAAAFGLMARAYESAPIRKLMMRLNAVPKGSTKFEETLTEIQSALTAGAQAAQE